MSIKKAPRRDFIYTLLTNYTIFPFTGSFCKRATNSQKKGV